MGRWGDGNWELGVGERRDRKTCELSTQHSFPHSEHRYLVCKPRNSVLCTLLPTQHSALSTQHSPSPLGTRNSELCTLLPPISPPPHPPTLFLTRNSELGTLHSSSPLST
uniref:Uncharacterized protein n=1 Tax=Desertifilum tharense IPPAS B-1220 TaxID=1781255 RepID=A0ACD5GZU2_9CYAN